MKFCAIILLLVINFATVQCRNHTFLEIAQHNLKHREMILNDTKDFFHSLTNYKNPKKSKEKDPNSPKNTQNPFNLIRYNFLKMNRKNYDHLEENQKKISEIFEDEPDFLYQRMQNIKQNHMYQSTKRDDLQAIRDVLPNKQALKRYSSYKIKQREADRLYEKEHKNHLFEYDNDDNQENAAAGFIKDEKFLEAGENLNEQINEIKQTFNDLMTRHQEIHEKLMKVREKLGKFQ